MSFAADLSSHVMALQRLSTPDAFRLDPFLDATMRYQESLELSGAPTGLMDSMVDLLMDSDREAEIDHTAAEAALETFRGNRLFPRRGEEFREFFGRLEELRQENASINAGPHHPREPMSRLFLPRDRLMEWTDGRALIPGYQFFFPLADLSGERAAEVYQAFDQVENRMVVLKVYRTYLRTEGVPLGGIFNELRFQADPACPDIARVRHAGRTQLGHPYLVSELMQGGSLRRVMEMRDAEEIVFEHAEGIVRQMINGVAMVHHHGIIHRDIKPDNFLLTGDLSRVRLADFGIALRHTEAARSAVIRGTVSYSPPEVFTDGEDDGDGDRCGNDFRRDVYSLGLSIYEYLSGVRPYELKALTQETPLSHSNPDCGIPQALDDLIRRATSPDPSRRYPSAIEMAEAFEDRFG